MNLITSFPLAHVRYSVSWFVLSPLTAHDTCLRAPQYDISVSEFHSPPAYKLFWAISSEGHILTPVSDRSYLGYQELGAVWDLKAMGLSLV